MAEIVTSLNLWEKLAKVQEIADVINKNKSGYGYKYASEEEVLAKVKAGLSKYRVLVYPRINTQEFVNAPRQYTKRKFDKASQAWVDEPQTEWDVSGEAVYTIVNMDTPDERIEIPWPICGTQGDKAQAFGSALTYCNRYFYLKFFNIATSDDDPDEWKRKKQEAANAEDAEAAKAIVQRIHETVTTGLEQHPDQKDALIKAIKRVLRVNGKPSYNYNEIKSLDDATSVFDVVSQFFAE